MRRSVAEERKGKGNLCQLRECLFSRLAGFDASMLSSIAERCPSVPLVFEWVTSCGMLVRWGYILLFNLIVLFFFLFLFFFFFPFFFLSFLFLILLHVKGRICTNLIERVPIAVDWST